MTFVEAMADGATTFEPYEPRAVRPERAPNPHGGCSQLSQPRVPNDDQNMNRSVEGLDHRISSVEEALPHDSDRLSTPVSHQPPIANYSSWGVEHKRLPTDQSPSFDKISSGASGFGNGRDQHHVMLVEDMQLAPRRTTPQLARVEEGHEAGGVGGHNECGVVFFNEFGRLRVQTNRQPPRNLVRDKSLIDDNNLKETAREVFNVMDTTKDGLLSRLEIMEATTLLSGSNQDFGANVDPSSDDFAKRLLYVTCNGSEKLDVDKFIDLVEAEVRSGQNPVRTKLLKMIKLFHEWLLSDREQLGTDATGDPCWMIHPTSKFNSLWRVFIAATSVALVFFLPLSVAWSDWKNVTEFNYIFEIIFMVDVAANLVTGYIDEDCTAIMKLREARRHYLHSLDFKIDLVASLPATLILMICGGMGTNWLFAGSGLKSIKMAHQCYKLFHLRRSDPLHVLTKRLSKSVDTSMLAKIPFVDVKFLRLVFLTFVLSHWMGSLQWLQVRLNDFPDDSWAVIAGLKDVPHTMQWSYSLFKALAQLILIGFEAPPFTNTACQSLSGWCQKEHWTTLACLYVGAAYYSFLISSMLSIIQANTLASTSYQDRLKSLNNYLIHKDVPSALNDQIRQHFRMNNPSRVYFDEIEVSKSLSAQHREAIRRHGVGDLVSLVPILAHPDNKAFAHCLTGHLSKVELDGEQILFNEGDIGDAMYFLHTGYIRLTNSFFSEKDGRLPLLASGCFFGEVALLTTKMARTMSAIGTGKCVLFRLERSTFQQLLAMFPDAATRIEHAADVRMRTLKRFKDECASLPTTGCTATAPICADYDPEDRLVPSLQKSKNTTAPDTETNDENDTAAASSDADLSDGVQDVDTISV